jgi:hypothetical protein
MFENLDYDTKLLIYEGLLKLVTSNSGEGFHGDQGHPAYRVGRSGDVDYEQWGDSPEHNRLFKVMHELSVSLNAAEEKNPTVTDYVFSWADFCRMATDAYDRQRKQC